MTLLNNNSDVISGVCPADPPASYPPAEEAANSDRKMLVKLKKLWKKLSARYGLTFASSMTAGLLAHMFALTNKLINHDDIVYLFGKGETLSSGRWGLVLMSALFPDYSMPWLYGLLSLVLFSVGACIAVAVFELKSPICQVLWGALFTSFPSLTCIMCYMFTATSYAVAFLLIIGGILLIKKRRIAADLSACLLFVLSLGIYQAYLGFICCFFVILLLQEVTDPTQKTGRILKDAARMFGVLLVTGIAYAAITWIVMQLTHTSFNDYAMQSLSSGMSVPKRTVWAYIDFFRQMIGLFSVVPLRIQSIMTLICMLAAMAVLLFRMVGKQPLPRVLMALLLLALFPLGVDCLHVLLSIYTTHALTQYSFVTGYLLTLTLIDRTVPSRPRLQHVLRMTVFAAAAVIVAGNIYYANETYLNLALRNEHLEAFYNQLITRVEMQPEFDSKKKVALIGVPEQSDELEADFKAANRSVGTVNVRPGMYSQEEYMRRWLGFDVPFASDEEIERIRATPEFAAMPCYPYYGSVAVIDEYVVVKMAED